MVGGSSRARAGGGTRDGGGVVRPGRTNEELADEAKQNSGGNVQQPANRGMLLSGRRAPAGCRLKLQTAASAVAPASGTGHRPRAGAREPPTLPPCRPRRRRA